MKKVLLVLFVSLFAFSLVGCGGQDNAVITDPLTDVMQAVVFDQFEADELPMSLTEMEVTEDMAEYYLGVADLDYKEALALEPMMSSVAFSVVLVRMNEGADIGAAVDAINSNVNPAKWICVEAENKSVSAKGDVIMLVMCNEQHDKIVEAFASYK